jgi:hypothetical protein
MTGEASCLSVIIPALTSSVQVSLLLRRIGRGRGGADPFVHPLC